MTQLVSEVIKIRRRVLTEIAKLFFNDKLLEEIDSIPRKLVNDGITHYRCCKYKEMAILKERIKLVLGVRLSDFNKDKRLAEFAEEKIAELSMTSPSPDNKKEDNIISIIEEACDQCSIEKIVVTNACRNCVAHSCVNSCPKEAITIVNNRAYIMKDKCIECGLCVKACSYGAIIEIDRPCNRACAVGAIVPGDKATAKIDTEACVECGSCIVACPFGAISSRSEMVKVINSLKNSEKKVVAMLAPSYIGQFGNGVDWETLVKGLKKMGFYDVVMVANGADTVIEEESQELMEKLNIKINEKETLFNSCCPSFKSLIKIHYPELYKNISSTDSPMLETAKTVLDIDDTVECIFIGPCLAKKGEALREGGDLITAVMTFEELIAMFVAADINLAKIAQEENMVIIDKEKQLVSMSENMYQASLDAVNFCQNGGVGQAVINNLKKKKSNAQVSSTSVSGISECKRLLELITKGKSQYNFVEGMGCGDGCIGGPGILVKPSKARGILKKMSIDNSKNKV